ncbi:MAG: carbon-nitrogen hydrolase family protein [Planctomycetes bacterium]|nr:carbon-nitrogen hydrolase family protein [Planctomycetota bacterium]
MRTLRVATCQFSVEPDIDHNRRQVLRQMKQAHAQKADVVHFSECALSGYAGVDIPDTKSIDWDELVAATQEIQTAAGEYKQWVLLGSTHKLSGKHKPHNSVYVINSKGKIVDRYDKRFCTGLGGKRPTMDLQHYSPGNRFVTFGVKGFTCGVLICYDYRFPELYREYKKQGAHVLFQSFHNARKTVVDDEQYNIWKTIVPATMSCRAAENHMWVSANNSTARPSRWGSFTVRPDGAIVGKLKVHRPGVLITEMAMDKNFFDAPGPWRESAMNGRLHSGKTVKDRRSADVTCL